MEEDPLGGMIGMGMSDRHDVAENHDRDLSDHAAALERSITRAQALVRCYVPSNVSLVDELLSERRVQASLDDQIDATRE